MNVEKKVFKRKIEQMKKAHKKNRPVAPHPEEEEGESGTHVDHPSSDVGSKAVSPPATTVSAIPSSILTDLEFESLRGQVSDKTLSAVADMGFTRMTEIQAKTIMPLLEVCVCGWTRLWSSSPHTFN